VLTPLVQKQIERGMAERGLTPGQARDALLGEKQPSGEFVTPEQLGALAAFLCSPAGRPGPRRGLTMAAAGPAQ
jgi:3-hydroxybutyrate dehydrogenase